MTEATTGMIILAVLICICAVVANALIRNLMVASVSAAVAAALFFQVAATIHLGYIDPFAPIAFVVSGFLAWVLAVLIGLVFRFARERHHSNEG